MHRLAGREVLEADALTTGNVDQRGWLQAKGVALGTIGFGAVEQHGIHLGQTLDWLAQRSGRQAAPIAQATGGVDQYQLQITRQGRLGGVAP